MRSTESDTVASTDRSVRSKTMAAVKSKDTATELLVRRYLHALGFRYRVNASDKPGSPDILLPKYRCAIFIHGCFWHRHGCKRSTFPKTNQAYWKKKFLRTIERDSVTVEKLREDGWRVLLVWECALKNHRSELDPFIGDEISSWIRGDKAMSEIPNGGE